ncbi:MAG: hypothetical protein FJ296_10465, partial [Planctomycetes bacterium]|nr:hypothetical protein [Planctomycetota bacterium]
GLTGGDGAFDIACKAGGQAVRDLLVRVEAGNRFRGPLDPPMPRLAVVDALGARWSASTPVFAAHDTHEDLDAGTTTVLPVSVAGSEGSAFNVYDMAVAAWEWVEQRTGAAPRGPLRLKWPSWSGSWALGRTAHVADDDGFDDAVILHELGHLVHNAWSDSDSPGGMHWFGDSDQDPRLSFSEGWATTFAGAVLQGLGQLPAYMDCDGAAVTGGADLRLDLETRAPYALATEGSADEVAVACALYDVLDAGPPGGPDADDDAFVAGLDLAGADAVRAFWSVFTGPVAGARRASVNSVWDGWAREFPDGAGYEALRSVFDQFGMRFWNDAFEPDGEPGLASLVVPGGFGPEHTLYWSESLPAVRGSGDEDWFAVALQAGQVVRIETRYPGGAADARTQADTQLAVFDPQGRRVASDHDGGAGRNARVDGLAIDQDGTWTFRVRSTDPLHCYGRYEVRVQLLP